jgi:hypothetical protein
MPILKAIGKRKDKNKKPIKFKQTPATFKMLLNYVTRKGKDQNEVYKSFGVGLSDDPEKAFKQTLFNWETFDTKDDIRLYKHYTKSYPKNYTDMETIEKITREFTEKNFLDRGFKCYVAIHQDKEHIHAHIITDCTNFLTGYKLQEIAREELDTRYKNKELRTHEFTLDMLKNSMEEIAKSYGLDSPQKKKINEKKQSINIGNMSRYKGLEKEDSYRNKIASVWEKIVLETTTTKENLFDKLKENGITITRFAEDERPITLTTKYTDAKGAEKAGKSKLTTLEKEEDYRFNATLNIYNWDNVLKILDKHKTKELEEELTADAIEKTIKEIEKELEKEKTFEKAFEEIKAEYTKFFEDPRNIIFRVSDEKLNDFLNTTSNFIKAVDAGEKDYNSISELNKLKTNEDFEKVLEININSKKAEEKRKQEEELEKQREEQKKRNEELEKQKKIQEQADKRNERYWNSKKNNNAVELNTNSYYNDISEEKNITKEVEEIKKDEVQTPSKKKEKVREYGE